MRTSILLSAVLAVALSGCVVHTTQPPPPPPASGDINVLWSFADGDNCADIQSVQVSIPGESLDNGGIFGCTNSGTQGITLFDFAGGSYDITVTAFDFSGRAAYSGSTSVFVDGTVNAGVTLQPLTIPPSSGNIEVDWAFGDGSTCTSLGGVVDHILITIPGEALDNGGQYGCTNSGAQGVQLFDFAPGSYQVTVSALDSSGFTLYQGTTTVSVNGDVVANVTLQATAAPGNINVTWTFPGGATCAADGVDHVVITIPGESLDNGGVYNCQTGGVQGVQLSDFAPGSYQISVSARTAGEVQLYSGTSVVSVNGDTSVNVALAQ